MLIKPLAIARYALWSALCVVSVSVFAGTPDRASEAANLPDLVVTGSRLSGVLPEGAPVTVVDRQTLLDSGQTSLGGFLQSLPFMSGAPLSTSVNSRESGGGFSRGIETVELRGLGAQRTLVLVNGRRFVPGGSGVGGLVDLAMIPLALVERIEVLKTGASVEYGADAVAGVVNVITRDRFEGVSLQADASQTEQGEAPLLNLSAITGAQYGQGRWVAGLSLFDQSAISKSTRGYSRRLLTVEGPENLVVPDGSSAPPAGNYRTSQGRLTLIDGQDGDVPADFRAFINAGPDTDRYNFNPFEDLRQEARRISVFSQWQHTVSESLQLFGALNWQQRDSATTLAPLPLFTNRLDGVVVDADNHYNPFGETLSDVRRRLVEAGPRGFAQDNQSWRALLGMEGKAAQWDWDVSLARGDNRVRQTQKGDLRRDRVALALGPSYVDATGVAHCGSAVAVVPDCVPMNVFGGAGSVSAPMLDYVAAADLTDRSQNRQTVVNANVRGDGPSLPAGDIRIALGYEYRNEAAQDVPDQQTQVGNTSGAARARTAGAFNSHEFYAEVGLPLLRDRPGVHALDMDLGARMVNFSQFDSAQVYELGLRYEPQDNVVLRAAYAKAFRAPTIGELFGGVSQSNPAVDDPCADFSRLFPVQRQRCIDQGVPAGGSFDQTGNETPQLGGGNADLQPEDSRIVTAGLSWQPAAVPDLSINLDFYDIRIAEGIASLGANTILQQCLATGAASYCDRVQRDASGAITAVHSALQNIASETAQGWDLELRYLQSLSGEWVPGRLRHSLLLSYVSERSVVAFPGGSDVAGAGQYDADSFGAIPRMKGQYALHWLHGDYDLGYGLQMIGALHESGGDVFPGTQREIAAQIYHDISVSYAALQPLTLQMGISNLTDRDPPFLANADVANTDVSTYRLFGRTYRLGLEYRW